MSITALDVPVHLQAASAVGVHFSVNGYDGVIEPYTRWVRLMAVRRVQRRIVLSIR